MLARAKAVIDYSKQTVTLYNDKYKLTNHNIAPEQNHFQKRSDEVPYTTQDVRRKSNDDIPISNQKLTTTYTTLLTR